MGPEQGKQGRDVRRMARFPCNGLLYVTPRDGFIQCVVKHSLDHVPYKEISIPEEWRQYITDNHNIGPAKVSVPCFIQSVLTEKIRQDLERHPSCNSGWRGHRFHSKSSPLCLDAQILPALEVCRRPD